MKFVPALSILVAAVAVSFAAGAQEAPKALKDNGCTKCHAVDKSKKGPAYQKVAAKYKGKADAEAKLVQFLTTGPKVKLDDGSEEEHKALKDAAVAKELAKWVLSQ